MKYFVVNQRGTHFDMEKEKGILWAPKLCKNKRELHHHKRILDISKGDVIISTHSWKLLSYNYALGSSYDLANPFPGDDWEKDGRAVDLEYHVFSKPIPYKAIFNDLLAAQTSIKGNPFNESKMNVGYLFELNEKQYLLLANLIAEYQNIPTPSFHYENYEPDLCVNDQVSLTYSAPPKILTAEEIARIDKFKKNTDHKERTVTSNRPSTNSDYVNTILNLSNYRCEVNPSHHTFLSKDGIHQFMEVHHIIPLKAIKDFDIELDHPYNMISLCPICHKMIHYGSKIIKEELFWEIYELKKEYLIELGIDYETMKLVFEKYF